MKQINESKGEWWRAVHNLNIKGMSADDKHLESWGTVDGRYQLISDEKMDRVRLEIQGNYGNKIYTDRASANALVLAIRRGQVEVTLRSIGSYMREQGFQYTTGW